jgi:hypothetical protein
MSLDNEFPQSRLLKLLIEIISLQITKNSSIIAMKLILIAQIVERWKCIV